jgi:hypothetical protein
MTTDQQIKLAIQDAARGQDGSFKHYLMIGFAWALEELSLGRNIVPPKPLMLQEPFQLGRRIVLERSPITSPSS